MTPEFVIGFVRQAIELTLSIALPMLLVGLGVGVFVSVIQAATQIQEMTLTFIPKLVAIFTALLISFPWIMDKLNTFTINLFLNLPDYVRCIAPLRLYGRGRAARASLKSCRKMTAAFIPQA